LWLVIGIPAGLVAFSLIVVAAVLLAMPKGDSNGPGGDTGKPAAAGPPVVEALTLFREFQREPGKAERRYLGKVLRVRGRVGEGSDGRRAVFWGRARKDRFVGAGDPGDIHAQGSRGAPHGVLAEMATGEPAPAEYEEVVLQGKCTGSSDWITLTECRVVK